MIERKLNILVHLTPEELADEFCNMNDTMQAEFFNYIYMITEKWDKAFCFQLQGITDNKILTDGGRTIMEQIGNYAK